VEAEARAGESTEDGGASARCHGAGADADLPGAAGEVRGGGGAAPGGSWRRRCSVRPRVRGGVVRTRCE